MRSPLKRSIPALSALLLGVLAAQGPHAIEPNAGTRDPEPILQVVVEVTKSEPAKLAAVAGSTAKRIRSRDGCDGTIDATFETEDGTTTWLRTAIFGSIADAEAASLAWDGSDESKRVDEVTDASRRQVWHFRGLRSKSYSDDVAGHLEVVVFRTRPGTTREANLQLFDAAEPDFANGKGLLGHSLWLAPDGRWVHLLRWRSAADYDQTGKALFRTQGVGGWIRSLDFRRFTVLRGDTI